MSDIGTQDRAASHTIVDASGPEVPEPRATLERGTIVGRYHVLERVGAGGMGVVYAAYDPDLDRKVAIKLLHHDTDESGLRSDGRTLLLREAQAMAKLSHPNVVAVHDVGVHEGTVFMAMEFVGGMTAAQWSAERPRTWPEVLDVFVAAGRGLAAAHAAGIVHRDFKPANVMCSDDGGVKVTDFGLARSRDEIVAVEPTARSPAVAAAIAAGGSRSGTPTQTGAVMGTPAYMAPEQHLGLPVDARSDQFSFCVALYEALYGRRPFTAESSSALAIAVVEGRIAEPPAGTKVPHWLRELLVRGLEPDPDRRFPSMHALQLELARDRGALRRRALLGLAAAVVIGGTAFAVSMGSRDAPCSDMGAHLVGVWDDDGRARVHTALLATGVGFVQSTWERVERGLDEYAEQWTLARTDACTATRVRGEQSEALLDLRMSCLDARLRSVRALVDVLGGADETVVANAVVMVAGLAPVAACADLDALRAIEPRPSDPGVVAQLDALDQQLAHAEQLGGAGKYAEALAQAGQVVIGAAPIGYAPMDVRALRRRGLLEHVNGADASAEQSLRAAFFLAVRHDLDELAAHVAAELVTIVGDAQQRTALGRGWAEHAAALAHADGDELLQASIQHNLAAVALREGDYGEARELATAALAERERLLGEESEAVLSSLNVLGLIAIETGRYDEARADFERELELARRILGPDHPELAKPLANLANVAWREADYPAARDAFERALQLQRAAFGEGHRNVAQLENNLAAVAMSTGDHEEAGRRFTHALAIWREVLGPEHPQVADALNNLAVVAGARGELEQAREYDERALAIREKVMAPDHPALAQNYGNLGSDLFRLGRVAEARALHERALAIYEQKLDPGHDDIAMILTALGCDLLALGEASAAEPLLERALALRVDARIDPVELAGTRWALARALPVRARARARELARQARSSYATAPSSSENPLAQIDAWLE